MKKRYIITGSIIISLLLIIVSISLAKYYSEKEYGTNVSSDKFYFTIDLMGDTNTLLSLEKIYHLYGGDSKEISFNIQNFFDELRYTNDDITYNVHLEGSYKDSSVINTTSLTPTKLEKGKCTLDTYTLSISEGYNDLDEVIVVATSTKPYAKTLRLKFVLHSYTENFSVDIIDDVNSVYAEVVISSNIYIDAYSIIIDYSTINKTSNMLKADMTNIYLIDGLGTNNPKAGVDYLQEVKITSSIYAGDALSILMFKKDISKNYSLCNIEIMTYVENEKTIYKISIKEKVGE